MLYIFQNILIYIYGHTNIFKANVNKNENIFLREVMLTEPIFQ